MAGPAKEVVLSARDVVVGFNEKNILDHLNLDVYRGEVLGKYAEIDDAMATGGLWSV